MISETEMNDFELRLEQSEVNRPQESGKPMAFRATTSILRECLTTITRA